MCPVNVSDSQWSRWYKDESEKEDIPPTGFPLVPSYSPKLG